MSQTLPNFYAMCVENTDKVI